MNSAFSGARGRTTRHSLRSAAKTPADAAGRGSVNQVAARQRQQAGQVPPNIELRRLSAGQATAQNIGSSTGTVESVTAQTVADRALYVSGKRLVGPCTGKAFQCVADILTITQVEASWKTLR
jgi:hypothetical protein